MQALHTDDSFKQEALFESLVILLRQTPAAVSAHFAASLMFVYAFSPIIPVQVLYIWFACLATTSLIRLLVSKQFLSRWPMNKEQARPWIRTQSAFSLISTSIWGSSVFIFWSDQVEYQALIIVVLVGIISASAVMLVTNLQSFTIHSASIALPLLYQLIQGGGRLDLIFATFLTIYIIILYVTVSRLEDTFMGGLILRFQMHALSETDALTNLANRRGFDSYLEDTWQNASRSGQSIGLILADIDLFKAYNDHYGHPAGDEALEEVGNIIRSVTGRSTDYCARIGGEEFAIVMPSTDLDGSIRIAKDLRQAFHTANIKHEGSPLTFLTISIGAASCIPTRSNSTQAFIEVTDKALYNAKDKGRDCIESGGEN
ncbi:MAG: diguanylate cyclase (GGDEF)-like protein [Candidatus Azotimanducaceae bacterium]|jgi:diguanylate cyclase (GGDEF)-like protein